MRDRTAECMPKILKEWCAFAGSRHVPPAFKARAIATALIAASALPAELH